MMLYDTLPQTIRIGRRRVKCDFDFRNVLRLMDILGEDDLLPDAREYLACKCVCKHPRRGMLEEIKKVLFGDGQKTEHHKRVTSFEQDAGMIRAAFLQAYGIDLYTEKVHWLKFMELLQNLPEDTQYMAIVGIRARDMPKPTKYNREEREWLRKAKAQYAIKVTEKEQEITYQQSVADIFKGIMSMIPKG